MPRKMLTRAFLSLKISKYPGGACPQTPLAARTFGDRNVPRLVLKSGYGPGFIKRRMLAFEKSFSRENTRLTTPEVRAVATSKA